jgi:hypothetical protein
MPTHRLQLNLLDNAVEWDVAGTDGTEVQAEIAVGAWGSAVLTYERSNDGRVWRGLETAVTQSSAGFSGHLYLVGVRKLRARVSTVAGADAEADLTPGE